MKNPDAPLEGACGKDISVVDECDSYQCDSDKNDIAFVPFYTPANSFSENIWVPGVIEVILKQCVPNEHLTTSDLKTLESPLSLDAEVIELVNQLHQMSIQRAEFSFLDLSEEASAQKTEGHARRNYRTFYFPTSADVVKISEELKKLSLVAEAVPVPKAAPPDTPKNEPKSGPIMDQLSFDPATGLYNQWYIARCRAVNAWDLFGTSGDGVVIADIDFGFLVTHEELRDQIEKKYNSFDGTCNVSQDGGIDHGTAVLGIAAAADNDLGIVGFAYKAKVWAVQANFGNQAPKQPGCSWANGIDWVRTTSSDGRRKVIMLEVQTCGKKGNFEMVPSVNRAIRDAVAANIVVCVAAGNGNRDAGIDDLGQPITPTGSVLVGATCFNPQSNERLGMSNFGKRIVVSAPGDIRFDLTCNINDNQSYRNEFGGTSGAVPKVAGAVALMLQKNPALSPEEVRNILHDTGSTIVTEAGKDAGTFLNAEAAVGEAIRREELSRLKPTLCSKELRDAETQLLPSDYC